MKSLHLNRLLQVWIFTVLLQVFHGQIQAGQEVGPVQVYFTGDHLELLIKSNPNTDYTVSTTNDHSIAMRFENTSASAIHKDPNFLWNFVPVTRISDMTRYSTVFLKIHFDNDSHFRLTHKMRSNGLHLYLWGDIVRQFNQKVFSYASKNYDQLTPEQQKAVFSVLEQAHQSDQFLLSEMKHAGQNNQFTWMYFLVSEMQKRDLLSRKDLKQIATTYDQGGRTDLSEPLWYEYYRQQVNSGENPYEDALPINVNIKKSTKPTPISKPKPSNFAAELSRSQFPDLPFKTMALWSLRLLSILVFSGGAFYLIKQKQVAAPAQPEISRQEQMEATFAEKLAQMRSDYKDNQTDQPAIEKTFTQAVKPEKPKLTSGESENSIPDVSQKTKRTQTYSTRSKVKSDTKKTTDSDIPRMRKRREVERLYKRGHSLTRIARSLNLSEGEVKLLLKLGEGDQRQPKMRVRKGVANLEGKSVKEIAQLLKISEEEAKLIQMTRSKA